MLCPAWRFQLLIRKSQARDDYRQDCVHDLLYYVLNVCAQLSFRREGGKKKLSLVPESARLCVLVPETAGIAMLVAAV